MDRDILFKLMKRDLIYSVQFIYQFVKGISAQRQFSPGTAILCVVTRAGELFLFNYLSFLTFLLKDI